MPITLRPAAASETEALRALVRAAYAPYLARMDREPAPTRADYAGLIAAEHVTAACEGESILGLLVCYPRGDHLHVENVAVAPLAQGKGIGRMLKERAEEEARARSLAAIELYTNAVMVENFPFYEGLGYSETGRGEEAGYTRVFYRKEIGPG